MPNSVPFSEKTSESSSSSNPFQAIPWPGPFIVLADDITGAAEIAGIAHSHGLKTKLTTTIGTPADGCDVLVLATDWRQMTELEAMEESRRATAFYAKTSSKEGKTPMIFKKTDSVLRGHILAECHGMLSALNENTVYDDKSRYSFSESDGKFRVLLIPQNPSKGRVVRGGLYYINERPIAETSFSYDPEFPAKSSVVCEILQHNLLNKAFKTDVCTENAETIEEIREIVSNCLKSQLKDEKIIFAGGADLFYSTISIYHNLSAQQYHNFGEESSKVEGKSPRKAMIVCGSTQSTDISQTKFCKENDFVLTTMPEAVFHGKEDPDVWINELRQIYKDHNLILTIGHKPQGGQAYAIRLRNIIANAVKSLSLDIRNTAEDILFQETSAPNLLIIEGGATAYQILQTLGWSEFLVSNEFAPGVVALKYKNENTIILKPGSYPWGNLFL